MIIVKRHLRIFQRCRFQWWHMKALDVEAVQAFVLAADLKSFTRAGEALDTTQSAVSLKIKGAA